jgi:hypothetical protein
MNLFPSSGEGGDTYSFGSIRKSYPVTEVSALRKSKAVIEVSAIKRSSEVIDFISLNNS